MRIGGTPDRFPFFVQSETGSNELKTRIPPHNWCRRLVDKRQLPPPIPSHQRAAQPKVLWAGTTIQGSEGAFGYRQIYL